MAQAEILNIYIEAKDTVDAHQLFKMEVTLEESEGVPMVDIDSATASFRIKRSYTDSTALVDITTASGGITINSVTGILTLIVLRSDITGAIGTSLQEQDYVYDLDLIDDNDVLFRIYKGEVSVGGDL